MAKTNLERCHNKVCTVKLILIRVSPSAPMDIKTIINNEFSLESGLIYLNHAAVSPWPARTANAVKGFADENHTLGAKHYLDWIKTETFLRNQFAQLINAPSGEDIAILKNTSEALSFVAYGLDWQAGDNIIISNEEFPSNSIIWHSLKKHGVEVRAVNLASDESPEQALISAIDTNTRLLSISSVQYASGLKMKLTVLSNACKKQNVLFCVDAIQSLGAIPFNLNDVDADFVMADTHKWMLGPEGITLFYCRPELREALDLHEYGWHMLEDMTNYTATEWVVTSSARRFECGSPNMLGIHAANASLSLILELGVDQIKQELLKRTHYTIELIQQAEHLQLISNPQPERLAGIVTFRSSKIESQHLYQELMKNNVICAARGGGVRFSPHFYTGLEDIKAATELANLTE